MPSATAGGWPYPLPTEPTRDGADRMKDQATELEKRFVNQMMVGLHVVATFDGNGLWYAPDWRLQWNITWADAPCVTVMAGDYKTGSQSLPVFATYMPHNNALQMVIRGIYADTGAVFSGAIDLFIVAAGAGKRG